MNKEIIVIDQTIEPIKKCRATRTSLEIPPDTTIEEWLRIGESLNTIYKGNKWWIGDWLNFGERKYGHMYPQGMDTDYDYNTLANYKWVASRVESSRRRELLSFTHHYEVAKFEPKEQEKWLARAEKEQWDRAEMRKQIREKNREITPLPKGKYNVLLIDPPWTYRNIGVEGAVDKEYPTMTIEELCKMPVRELATQNAVLFLWTTNPILEECFPVIKSWDFEYKTNFCWIKRNKKTGIGFYVRGIHELLLICIKGQMLPKYTPLSVIEEDAKEHSRKPEIHSLIEKMYPNCKYIELFARNNKKRSGWAYWGNEANI